MPGIDPLTRPFEGLARIGVEYQTLAGTEFSNGDQYMISARQLSQKIAFVGFRLQVDVMLRALQGFAVLLDIAPVGAPTGRHRASN